MSVKGCENEHSLMSFLEILRLYLGFIKYINQFILDIYIFTGFLNSATFILIGTCFLW